MFFLFCFLRAASQANCTASTKALQANARPSSALLSFMQRTEPRSLVPMVCSALSRVKWQTPLLSFYAGGQQESHRLRHRAAHDRPQRQPTPPAAQTKRHSRHLTAAARGQPAHVTSRRLPAKPCVGPPGRSGAARTRLYDRLAAREEERRACAMGFSGGRLRESGARRAF